MSVFVLVLLLSFFKITFALFSIIDICKLLCVCVKGVILNEDLMMMMMALSDLVFYARANFNCVKGHLMLYVNCHHYFPKSLAFSTRCFKARLLGRHFNIFQRGNPISISWINIFHFHQKFSQLAAQNF